MQLVNKHFITSGFLDKYQASLTDSAVIDIMIILKRKVFTGELQSMGKKP